MVWLKGMPAREAAAKLGISEAAVSQHLKKARELVGQSLSSRGVDLVM
jgi:DNA-directed RNA polymerase specialized sigma24 family protein